MIVNALCLTLVNIQALFLKSALKNILLATLLPFTFTLYFNSNIVATFSSTFAILKQVLSPMSHIVVSLKVSSKQPWINCSSKTKCRKAER